MSNTRRATGTVKARGNGHGAVNDLDALAAEAAGEPWPFRAGGREYVLPHIADWPRKALRALASGELFDAFAILFGPEEAEHLEGAMNSHMINAVTTQIASWGNTEGESEASGGS